VAPEREGVKALPAGAGQGADKPEQKWVALLALLPALEQAEGAPLVAYRHGEVAPVLTYPYRANIHQAQAEPPKTQVNYLPSQGMVGLLGLYSVKPAESVLKHPIDSAILLQNTATEYPAALVQNAMRQDIG
jgi:hypothetical protein